MTQGIYESMGGVGPIRYGGNVFGIKFLTGPEINYGDIFGSNWDRISASINVGFNFSLFDFSKQGYTQSGEPTWLHSWLIQLEFFKVIFLYGKYFRGFSSFTEFQLWKIPTDVDAVKHGIKTTIPKLILGVRMYVFF